MFFNDSEKNSKGGITWQQDGQWHTLTTSVQTSTQRAELMTAIVALQQFPSELINIFADSAYIVHTLTTIDDVLIHNTIDYTLYSFFISLQYFVQKRCHPVFVSHLRAQLSLPGPLTESNAQADTIVMTTIQQEILSHQFFHQGACSLCHEFHISKSQAQSII